MSARFVNGYILSTNNGALTGNNVNTRVSIYNPGIGLRYQFQLRAKDLIQS
jgi:hypothetical protein